MSTYYNDYKFLWNKQDRIMLRIWYFWRNVFSTSLKIPRWIYIFYLVFCFHVASINKRNKCNNTLSWVAVLHKESEKFGFNLISHLKSIYIKWSMIQHGETQFNIMVKHISVLKCCLTALAEPKPFQAPGHFINFYHFYGG